MLFPRLILTATLLAGLSSAAFAQPLPAPESPPPTEEDLIPPTQFIIGPQDREARAMWVVRYALASPESVRRIVELARTHKFNALFVQVRGRGDAYYTGGLEPRTEFLEGQPPEFDPLALLIREARIEGIQVHAWLNTFYLWSGTALPKSPQHLVNAHPEWLLADRTGTVQYTAGADREGAYLDPGRPEARRFLHDVFLDVARRYPVNGIHFDYVRYPGADYGFSDDNLKRFREKIDPTLSPAQIAVLDSVPDRNAYPTLFPERWNGWRRDNVTDLVRSVYRDVKKIKPDLAVSAALIPWGVFHSWEESDAYNRVNQDWFGWMREGILDIAVPMTYHTDTPSFAGWVQAAVQYRYNSQVWAGIGAYLLPPESTVEKIVAARRLRAHGFSLFSYDAITRNGTDASYLDRVEDLALQGEALYPPLRPDRALP
ncbi:MAG: family 10 glycosylhydrolase [Armatimonadetes bacterium]|nr:family 10 glycosylhydrolase [Armatimonadota bacterium]